MKSNKNICGFCGRENPDDNFNCEHEDCGAPMDLTIEYLSKWEGLPTITHKNNNEDSKQHEGN